MADQHTLWDYSVQFGMPVLTFALGFASKWALDALSTRRAREVDRARDERQRVEQVWGAAREFVWSLISLYVSAFGDTKKEPQAILEHIADAIKNHKKLNATITGMLPFLPYEVAVPAYAVLGTGLEIIERAQEDVRNRLRSDHLPDEAEGDRTAAPEAERQRLLGLFGYLGDLIRRRTGGE